MREGPGRNGGTLKFWEKGESGNPKGRPRKRLSLLEKEIGIQFSVSLSRADKYAILESMLEMSATELAKIAKSKDSPIFMVSIAKAIIDDINKGRINTLSELFDRFFGKPTQPISGDSDGAPIVFQMASGKASTKSDSIE